MTNAPNEDVCTCKIGRQREHYGLRDLDSQLIRRRQEDNQSLRDLATFVNTQVLESAIKGTDADVAGDPRSVYEALTNDDVSPERRADVEDRLELVGVDIQGLRLDFISHQTVKNHLTKCLDLDTSRDGIESVEEGRAKLDWADDRHRTVVESIVGQLNRKNQITVGEYDITKTTSITCRDCERTYRIDKFLQLEGCECMTEGE